MPYTPPAGNQVALALFGDYTPALGNQVALTFGDPAPPPEPPEPPFRGPQIQIGMPWAQAPQRQAHAALPWAAPAGQQASNDWLWSDAPAHQALFELVWHPVPRADMHTGLAWQEALRAEIQTGLRWQPIPRYERAARLLWSLAPQAQHEVRITHAAPPQRSVRARMVHSHAAPVAREVHTVWLHPGSRRLQARLPWRDGRPLQHIATPPDPPLPPDDPEIPQYEPPLGNQVALRFGCPPHTAPGNQVRLPFGPWACYPVRARRRVYHVINSVDVIRLPDEAPINCSRVSIGTNADSWLWTFDADVADADSLDLCRPAIDGSLREVQITINGFVWIMIVDGIDERRAFGAMQRRITGRSATAYLGEPWAPKRSRVVNAARTAIQLCEEFELDSTGITLDWNAVDWLVPAGAWYYQDLRPIDAILSIAEAAGAIVQSHPTLPQLIVQPRYPAAPWAWPTETIDVYLQDDYMLARGGAFGGGTRAERVIVQSDERAGGGSPHGVRVVATITGTAGEILAPQVSHPLITTVEVGTARAIRALAESGPMQDYSVELPLFASPTPPGLLTPGKLVEVAGDWIGLTKGVQISAQRDGPRLTVRQIATIERHTDAS